MAVHRQRGGLGLSVEPCGCRRIHSVLGERGIAHVQALLRCPIIFAEAEDALSVACVGGGTTSLLSSGSPRQPQLSSLPALVSQVSDLQRVPSHLTH